MAIKCGVGGACQAEKSISRLNNEKTNSNRRIRLTIGRLRLSNVRGTLRAHKGFAAAMGLVVISAITLTACSWPWGAQRAKLSPRVVALGQPVPKGGGVYKVGQPYQVAGRWYYPREDQHYDRVGLASWYGELFHGRYTANGEIYDMDGLSAAHPTLPLPSYAKVTNLANGKAIVVRINDRGPYAGDRIIDLSRRSASLLGFAKTGTATVRVRYLGRAPLNGDDRYERHYLASQEWMQPYWRWRLARPTEQDLTVGSVHSSRRTSGAYPQRYGDEYYIQAGAFRLSTNAERMRQALGRAGRARIESVSAGGDLIYRVVLGPYPEKQLAVQSLREVATFGIQDARIFVRPALTLSRY